MPSIIRYIFSSSFPIWMSKTSVLCWMKLSKVAILDLFLILNGKNSVFLIIKYNFIIKHLCFSYMAFVIRYFPFIHNLLSVFIVKYIKFCQMFVLHQLRLSYFSPLYSFNVVYYIDPLWYVEPSLHSRNKSHLIMVCNSFNIQLNSVCFSLFFFCNKNAFIGKYKQHGIRDRYGFKNGLKFLNMD